MTDTELQLRLRRVPVPERSAEYWDDFPWRVRMQLRERDVVRSGRRWLPRVAWAGALAMMLGLMVAGMEWRLPQAVSRGVALKHQEFHAQMARWDIGLHKLILNTDGMGYLLTD